MSEVAPALSASFRVVFHIDGEEKPPETTLPFVPFIGMHLKNPADGFYAIVRLVGWDEDAEAFFVSFEE